MVLLKVSEKKKLHYYLEELKELIRQERWIVTKTADKGALNLGYPDTRLKKLC